MDGGTRLKLKFGQAETAEVEVQERRGKFFRSSKKEKEEETGSEDMKEKTRITSPTFLTL